MKCEDCYIEQNYNIEDDDSQCQNCEEDGKAEENEPFRFYMVGDIIVREMARPDLGDGFYQREIIMDKATFVKAFNKWCDEE